MSTQNRAETHAVTASVWRVGAWVLLITGATFVLAGGLTATLLGLLAIAAALVCHAGARHEQRRMVEAWTEGAARRASEDAHR